MTSDQTGSCSDLLVAWNFDNADSPTDQDYFEEGISPLPLFGDLNHTSGLDTLDEPTNLLRPSPFERSKCSCTIDIVALVKRLSDSMGESELAEFTAFLPELRNVCRSRDTNVKRSFIAMDWFVHQFGPTVLRTVGNTWMATELEKTPRTVDHRTLDRAINACSGATYFIEGACSQVFHAGYQAGEALLEMKSGSSRSTGAFGRALGGAVATGESMINSLVSMGHQGSGRGTTKFARLNNLGWDNLVTQLLTP